MYVDECPKSRTSIGWKHQNQCFFLCWFLDFFLRTYEDITEIRKGSNVNHVLTTHLTSLRISFVVARCIDLTF